MKTSIVALLLSTSASFAQAPSAEQLVPLSQAQFSQVDAIVQKAMKTALIPGAVLIIGHEGEVVSRQAYGSRALVPRRETMTLDTIFDAASLTRVAATTPCVTKLFEQGKVRWMIQSQSICLSLKADRAISPFAR